MEKTRDHFPDPAVTPTIRMIKNWFFCEAAGMPEIAYKILSNPDPYKGAQPIQSYIQAKIDRRDLTPDELEGLAIELEKQTADSETQNGHRWVFT
jgi:hypothetical protein